MSKFLSNLDLQRNELQSAIIHKLAAAPSSPVEGLTYYDTVIKKLGVFQNLAWVYLDAGLTNVTKVSAASAAGVLQVSGSTDRTIADYISAGGIVKVSVTGVSSIATIGTDYLTGTSTNILVNKSYDAMGIGNVLANVQTSNFAVNVVDTDVLLTANSDTRISSQKAVKAYIDAGMTAAVHFKGVIDASVSPNYPAAIVGDLYKISVAGLIGGASGIAVQVNDSLYATVATVTGTQAAVGANWDIIQANVDLATNVALGLTTYATGVETIARTLNTKAVTPLDLASFPSKYISTIGDGVAVSYVVTHNLNTKDVTVTVRDATTDMVVYPDIATSSLTTAIIYFASAPAASAYKVTITG